MESFCAHTRAAIPSRISSALERGAITSGATGAQRGES
jgi:hypothetical protein